METKYTALIERYFDNELSPEEIAQVVKLNETEVDFQKEFELFEKANEPKFNYFPENDDHMMEYNDELLNNIKLFINKI